MIRQLLGDCRVTLDGVAEQSIQAVITSPPYFGLRNYDAAHLVWGGVADHEHEFLLTIPGDNRGGSGTFNGRNRRGENYGRDAERVSFCGCGAWLGSLGNEPTTELYIEHLVEVFRHARRVLHDDGVVWLNLGDSYSGSGKGPTGHNGIGDQEERQGFSGKDRKDELPGKNLMMIPARVALALQRDGWIVRSQIPWVKRNSMPESATDRPNTAVEYVYVLAKSDRYYWDGAAVGIISKSPGKIVRLGEKSLSKRSATGIGVVGSGNALADSITVRGSRNRRNSDWFFESWQGLMLDEDGDPLALVVNPVADSARWCAVCEVGFDGRGMRRSIKGEVPTEDGGWQTLRFCPDCGNAGSWTEHFAAFPPKIVEPMIASSTRPGDTVADVFAGTGTVGVVADRMGRDAVLCELREGYGSLATERLMHDAPMFMEFC